MDYEKLVAELRDWLPPESEKIPYGELVARHIHTTCKAHWCMLTRYVT